MERPDWNFINLNQFTWHLNIAVAGLIFSVFSLIYNEDYIYYGFFTFLFGVLGHATYKLFCLILGGDIEGDKRWSNYYVILFSLIVSWILAIHGFYFS